MPNNPFHTSESDPGSTLLKITPGAAMPRGTCRAICCGTAGTLDGTDEDGNAFVGFPLQQGYNPIRVQAVAATGTATNLWALY